MMGRPTPAPGQAQHPLKPLYTHSSWLFSRLLNEATGSLLDDVQLVNTLRTSKITATEVTEQLETSETTEINIDLARHCLREWHQAPPPRHALRSHWPQVLGRDTA